MTHMSWKELAKEISNLTPGQQEAPVVVVVLGEVLTGSALAISEETDLIEGLQPGMPILEILD